MLMKAFKSTLLLLGLLILLAALGSCSNSEFLYSSAITETDEDAFPGMLRVSAGNSTIALGTGENQAKANERPQMIVAFDYSFLIGRHEVTCAEFINHPCIGSQNLITHACPL